MTRGFVHLADPKKLSREIPATKLEVGLKFPLRRRLLYKTNMTWKVMLNILLWENDATFA